MNITSKVFRLTWPILIEQFLFLMMGTADTVMLSHISNGAVVAVAASNQVVNILLTVFNVVSSSTGILVAQYRGANRPQECASYSAGAVTVNLWFGILISVIVLLMRHTIGTWMHLPDIVLRETADYLLIVGSTVFIQALLGTVSAVLRTNGFTRQTMIVSLGMNVVHIFGNYLFIFGGFGVPKLGVIGVAISTSVSRLLALAVMFFLMYRLLPYAMKWRHFTHVQWEMIRKLFAIGIPAAGEPLAYEASQIVMTSFMAIYGATVLVTRVYTLNIMFYIADIGIALGIGTQIVVGQLVGAGEVEEAYRLVWRTLRMAFSVALLVSLGIAVSGHLLYHLFTNDPYVIWMGTHLLFICILLEPGRTFNLVMVQSLRAAGDLRYPVILGIIFPLMLGIPLSYFLGIYLHMGLFGVWWAICLDEWIRGLLNVARWHSRRWEQKILMQPEQTKLE